MVILPFCGKIKVEVYMKIFIGSDYRGLELKRKIVDYLESKDYMVEDTVLSEEKLYDYPNVSFDVAEKVRTNKDTCGILICGSGHGICIAANKVKGIRCIRATSVIDAKLGREHDNANILALASEITTDFSLVIEIVETFLNTSFPNIERRVNRIKLLANYEEQKQ